MSVVALPMLSFSIPLAVSNALGRIAQAVVSNPMLILMIALYLVVMLS